MEQHSTLIALLGGQPQIVTFTLDLLLARGERIHQVIAAYLSPNPRYYDAYTQLLGEFVGDLYAGKPCHLRAVPIRTGDRMISEAATPAEVEMVHKTFYALLSDLKRRGERIHLSLSGGRRMLALVALEAAMQYLAPTDRIWHIYTPAEWIERARDGAMMHLPPESGLGLVAVPFVPWAAYFPGLAPLLERTPSELREAELGWLAPAERERCRQVWEVLTPRQREVLRALVADNLSRKGAAQALHIAVSTLDTHRNTILQRCQEVWAGEPDGGIDLQFVRRVFNPFLHGLMEV